MHEIPILGISQQDTELKSKLLAVLPEKAKLSNDQKIDGLNMDPATVALIIEATKEILIAAIGAIGTVWAAKVATEKAASEPQKESSTTESKNIPVIEIDTLADTYEIGVDENLEQNLNGIIPDNIKNVLNIRLSLKG